MRAAARPMSSPVAVHAWTTTMLYDCARPGSVGAPATSAASCSGVTPTDALLLLPLPHHPPPITPPPTTQAVVFGMSGCVVVLEVGVGQSAWGREGRGEGKSTRARSVAQ
eukprot:TRINITY_DN4890_c0_g1_i1.p1 TRINITY_DN4890_c0_g1~~TRINITY_DN4890_c0_g1_i1.p1  ORF type:complete len:110 (-),score=26.87 TRINITY_DN4890_c0_g1_i1:339-668(-)